MMERLNRASELLENMLGRKLTTDEAYLIGYTYPMAFNDGKEEAMKEIKEALNQ